MCFFNGKIIIFKSQQINVDDHFRDLTKKVEIAKVDIKNCVCLVRPVRLIR